MKPLHRTALLITVFAALPVAFLATRKSPEHPAESPTLPRAATSAPESAVRAAAPQVSPMPQAPRDLAETRMTAADRLGENPMLKRRLNLTDEQAKSVRQILSRDHAQSSAVQHDPNLSRPDRLAGIRRVQDATDQSLAAVLTPAQLEEWRRHRSAPQNPLTGPSPSTPSKFPTSEP